MTGKWSAGICIGAVAAVGVAALLYAGGSVVPVGTYLYANPADKDQYKGRLTIRFNSPGRERLVIAYGRKYRKDRKAREGTSEEQREKYKPWLGKLIDDGQGAIFWNLPADYYDIVVVDPERMTVHEGLGLINGNDPELATDDFLAEIKTSLGLRTDRIGGWEAFFDNKQFERFETDGSKAGIFVQQMRLGKALAESGAVLKGCIHSIDIVWAERAVVEGAGWQVIDRQQLYRDEIPARTFFKHHFVPELQGIRIGLRQKEIDGVELPTDAEQ
jgi:hypothetical protein